MASAEPAPASLGIRYAPDDPTLPKPWKGLIDGSTGVLYYWNPETNVTQYDKPATVPPPLPQGPPHAASTPKLAPIPVAHTMQPNGMVAPHGQQLMQAPQQQGQQAMQASQQQGQQMSQLSQQYGQVMAQQQGPLVAQVSQQQGSQSGQQQSSQYGQVMQQPGQLHRPQPRQQTVQHAGQHMPQPSQQLPQQLGHQMQQQAIQQMPQNLGQQAPQHQGSQMAQPQVQPFTHQQLHYMAYQQSMHPQQQQTQHSAQGQSFPNQQEYNAAFPKREEVDFQQGNQIGFSPFQQTGAPSVQNLPGGTNSVQMPHMGVHSGQAQQFGSSSANMQQPSSLVEMQKKGADLNHQQHGTSFQNQMGPMMMPDQQPTVPLVRPTMGYENSSHGRGGNEYYFNAHKEGPIMGPQHPKLAAIPMARNQEETRTGAVPLHNMPPGNAGGLNAVAGHGMHNMFNHATSSPFPNAAPTRPPSVFPGSSDVMNLSPTEAYCREHEVTATGDNVPTPFMTFEATGFPPEILREIHSAGFSSPTPIQAQTWPIALQSRDIVAIAKTGSGKTLGYLIPAFVLLRESRNKAQNGPTVVVLAPTRELATQIQDEVIKFGRSSRVSCTCLYGGAPKGPQLKELDRGADIVVATPGRLNDILEMKKINFAQVSLLVLDEADRMLDMGFEPQIRKIVNEIPPRRQTLMYTATWPKEVRKIAGDLLVNPVQVNIGRVDELAANKAITQYVEVVPEMEKQRRLEQILRAQERGSKVIIFCSTKKLCDQLARNIGRNFGASVIHGDKSQGERDFVLNQFRSGKSPILVATDVAARGLDIKDIRVVINYDFPTGIEDYVHRIGRTGRAGATGMAYTFFSDHDWKYAADLIKVLEGANQQVPPEVREMAQRGGPSFGKDRGGVSRFDSGGSGGGRWDSGGRGGMREGGFGGRGGMRDGGFGGRGGMRDGGFGGRSGMRDGGFGGRGGMRDGGFGGRGGMRDSGFGGRGGMRDGAVGGPGGRSDFFSGSGNRGRGFGGRGGGGNVGWGRTERGPDRYNNNDGRGRGRSQGRFDNRRDISGSRGRSRSYSRSPERVRTWGYSRSRSRSRSHSSRSRSRSWSRSRSRSRSWSRGRSRSRSVSRSRNRARSRSRSRSRSYDRYKILDKQNVGEKDHMVLESEARPESRTSPMSPSKQGNAISGAEIVGQQSSALETTEPAHPESGVDPSHP